MYFNKYLNHLHLPTLLLYLFITGYALIRKDTCPIAITPTYEGNSIFTMGLPTDVHIKNIDLYLSA